MSRVKGRLKLKGAGGLIPTFASLGSSASAEQMLEPQRPLASLFEAAYVSAGFQPACVHQRSRCFVIIAKIAFQMLFTIHSGDEIGIAGY